MGVGHKHSKCGPTKQGLNGETVFGAGFGNGPYFRRTQLAKITAAVGSIDWVIVPECLTIDRRSGVPHGFLHFPAAPSTRVPRHQP